MTQLNDAERQPMPRVEFTFDAGYDGVQTVLGKLVGFAFRVKVRDAEPFDAELLAVDGDWTVFKVWEGPIFEGGYTRTTSIELDLIESLTYL